MPMTPLPTLDRTSATFKTDVDDFFSTDLPQFVTEANALETAVDADATAAANSASAASTSASNAATSETNAAASASAAASSASDAATSAATAASAPGTSASSTTSLTIGTGSKALTIETGKALVIGMSVKIAEIATPGNWMHGDITSYDSGTGALNVNVTNTNGVATASAWTVSLSAPIPNAAVGALGIAPEHNAGDKTLTASSGGYQIVQDTVTSPITFTLPDATGLDEGALMFIFQNDSGVNAYINDDGGNFKGVVEPGYTLAITLEDNATTNGTWRRAFKTSSPEVSGGIVVHESTAYLTTAFAMYNSLAWFTDTYAVACFRDQTDNRGRACVLQVDGNRIIAGGLRQFNTVTVHTKVVALDSTRALVAFSDSDASSTGRAVILTRDGTHLTNGAEATFESGSTSNIGLAKLSSTKVIATYRDSGNLGYATACVMDISGTTITPGSATVIDSVNCSDTDVVALSSTKALAIYRDGDNGNYGTAMVLDISGTTITPNTDAVFNSTSTTTPKIAKLSSTKAVVIFGDYADSDKLKTCVLDVSGSTVTPGTVAAVTTYTTDYLALAEFSETKVIAFFRDKTTSNEYYGKLCFLSVSGSTVAPGTATEFNYQNTLEIAAKYNNNRLIVAYRDMGAGDYGLAKLIDFGEL